LVIFYLRLQCKAELCQFDVVRVFGEAALANRFAARDNAGKNMRNLCQVVSMTNLAVVFLLWARPSEFQPKIVNRK
jgi:hypothetical protein